VELLSSTPPLNFPDLGELKMRDLKGYLTPSNPLKSFLLPPKKTHKQGFIKHPYPLPSTLPSSPYPNIALF
jgi:hypothetical protein